MKIIVKGSFDRDIDRIHNRELKHALLGKINQIESAKEISQITGLKKLKGYSNHVRIIVRSKDLSFRIGGILRGKTIWLVRFLPRKKIYKEFP